MGVCAAVLFLPSCGATEKNGSRRPLATGKLPLTDEQVWLERVVSPPSSPWTMRKESMAAYGSSKLANTLFAAEVRRILVAIQRH